MKGHVVVAVPEGHMVQVHPPMEEPQMPMPPPGMVPNAPADGAKAAMDQALAPAKPKSKKKPAKK